MEDITDINDFRLFGRKPAESKHLFESIFATICQQFTCDCRKNTLIPSPSLYEKKQVCLLNVVTMKKKQKMFGRSVKEYSTYDISLANLLNGQPELEIQVDNSEYSLQNSYTCIANSLKWKTGGRIIDIIEGCLSFFFDIKITCKFGKLTEQAIEYQSFMSALKNRKLDMNHHFIREIKDAKQVLCVIRNVMKTSDKAEIKCTIKAGGNINVSEKVNWFFRVNNGIEAMMSSVSGIVIKPETALAYEVWELSVDVESGEITPIMMAHNSGGYIESADFRKIEKYPVDKFQYIKDNRKKEKYFVEKYHYSKAQNGKKEKYSWEKYHYIKAQNGKKEKYSWEKYHYIKDQQKMQSNVNRSDEPIEGDPHPPNDDQQKMQSNVNRSDEPIEGDPYPSNDDEVEKAARLQDLQAILQPLRDCTEANYQQVKCSLFKLMTYSYSDVVAISKLLSKAEDGCLNEEKYTIDKQFTNKDKVWSILKFVGVQAEEGRVLYEKEATPKLIALVYVIDALLEFENDDFDFICRCDKPQLKTLSKIFESAVASSMPISIDVDMSSVLKEPVSSFLTHKKFTVCNDSIQPPKTKTCNVECIFCVLYCLS